MIIIKSIDNNSDSDTNKLINSDIHNNNISNVYDFIRKNILHNIYNEKNEDLSKLLIQHDTPINDWIHNMYKKDEDVNIFHLLNIIISASVSNLESNNFITIPKISAKDLNTAIKNTVNLIIENTEVL